MTAVQDTSLRDASAAAASTPVPLGRLTKVELRKLVDTRSGRWLLIAIAVLTAGVIAVYLFAASPDELTYDRFVQVTSTPQSILLPLLGILTVTSEWGQRTGLVTFTLEPRRGRVVLAKLNAVVLLGLAAVAVALLLAALGNVLGAALQDGDGAWGYGPTEVREVVVLQLSGVLQGLAFGMLLTNAAAAIVLYFALPTVWGILTSTVEWFRDIATWVDLGTTSAPLVEHDMDAGAWARFAVSVLIWVAVPLALGWWRLLRRELKAG